MTTAHSPANADTANSQTPHRLGWFIGGTVVSAVVYSMFTTFSAGRCTGGATVNESVDASSAPEPAASLCTLVTVGPSPVVYAIVVAIAIVAFVLARQLSDRPVQQNRVLGAALAATAIVCFASLILARVWIASIDMEDWDGTATYDWSVPAVVADVDVQITRG